jgi:hypothetical protein
MRAFKAESDPKRKPGRSRLAPGAPTRLPWAHASRIACWMTLAQPRSGEHSGRRPVPAGPLVYGVLADDAMCLLAG